jgi:hypothetical protein
MIQPADLQTVALREQFSKVFPDNPEGAVDLLRKQVSWGGSRQAAAEVLLPYVVKAAYAQQNFVSLMRKRAACVDCARADLWERGNRDVLNPSPRVRQVARPQLLLPLSWRT